MPRGMDERFENPSEETEDEEGTVDDETKEATSAERQDRESAAATAKQSEQQGSTDTAESATEETAVADEEPLNIRKDWDSATIYVEPEQSEDIEVTFTRVENS